VIEKEWVTKKGESLNCLCYIFDPASLKESGGEEKELGKGKGKENEKGKEKEKEKEEKENGKDRDEGFKEFVEEMAKSIPPPPFGLPQGNVGTCLRTVRESISRTLIPSSALRNLVPRLPPLLFLLLPPSTPPFPPPPSFPSSFPSSILFSSSPFSVNLKHLLVGD